MTDPRHGYKRVMLKLGGEMFGGGGVGIDPDVVQSVARQIAEVSRTGAQIAIVIGGPGAVFWMWLLALVGGATAYIESALAQLYKRRGHDGFVGGPAYYIKHGLGQGWMAILFAVMITLTYGFVFNAVQSNSISESVVAN